jgi:hypothetical protein
MARVACAAAAPAAVADDESVLQLVPCALYSRKVLAPLLHAAAAQAVLLMGKRELHELHLWCRPHSLRTQLGGARCARRDTMNSAPQYYSWSSAVHHSVLVYTSLPQL